MFGTVTVKGKNLNGVTVSLKSVYPSKGFGHPGLVVGFDEVIENINLLEQANIGDQLEVRFIQRGNGGTYQLTEIVKPVEKPGPKTEYVDLDCKQSQIIIT